MAIDLRFLKRPIEIPFAIWDNFSPQKRAEYQHAWDHYCDVYVTQPKLKDSEGA